MSAPRVLVSGVLLGQPMSGVRRHNMELLPRLARLLVEHGGGLSVLAGREGLGFPLPPEVEILASSAPAHPTMLRALLEGRALRAALRTENAGSPRGAGPWRSTRFDLVHTAHFPAPRGLSVPFTLTIHDLRRLAPRPSRTAGATRPIVRPIARAVVREAARRARLVIAVSESVRAEIVAELGVGADRVRVVPNAGDHFEPIERRPTRDARILCLGHLEPRKNLGLVLHALALDRTLPGLVLAGAAKGAHAEDLADLATRLGVRERVEFLGGFPDSRLPELYAAAAVVVLPSHVEGFGIAALEAQRARAPLAVARIPSLLEVAGSDVPSFDPDDAAECVRALRTAISRTDAELDRDRDHADRYRWDASARAWFDACVAACAC